MICVVCSGLITEFDFAAGFGDGFVFCEACWWIVTGKSNEQTEKDGQKESPNG